MYGSIIACALQHPQPAWTWPLMPLALVPPGGKQLFAAW